MVQRKITWVAELGNKTKEFPTKKEAEQAEKEYGTLEEIEKLNNIFRKYFKISYGEKDRGDKYLGLCVDCGEKLLEYNTEWDGHRNERGDILYSKPNKAIFLDGCRCPKCNDKIIRSFQEMLQFYQDKTHYRFFIDTKNWEQTYDQDREILAQIFRMVDFWDKNKIGKKK